MKWIPPRFLRPAKLSTVSPVGILLPLDRYDGHFIVAGSGSDVFACFLGEEHRFEGFLAASAEDWKGLAVEGLEIQVDLDSATSLDGSYPRPGSVVRRGSELQLVVTVRNNGFRDTRRVLLADGLPAASDDEQVAFGRWKAIVREGEDAVCVADVTATSSV